MKKNSNLFTLHLSFEFHDVSLIAARPKIFNKTFYSLTSHSNSMSIDDFTITHFDHSNYNNIDNA